MNNLSKKIKILLILSLGMLIGLIWLFTYEIGESLGDFLSESKPNMVSLSAKDAPLIKGYVLRPTPALGQTNLANWRLIDFELLPESVGTVVKVLIESSTLTEEWPRFQVEMLGEADKVLRSFVVADTDYDHPKDSQSAQRSQVSFIVKIRTGEKNIKIKVMP